MDPQNPTPTPATPDISEKDLDKDTVVKELASAGISPIQEENTAPPPSPEQPSTPSDVPPNGPVESPLLRTFDIDSARAQGKTVQRTFSITRSQKKEEVSVTQPTPSEDLPLEVDPNVIPAENIMGAPTLHEGRDFSKMEKKNIPPAPTPTPQPQKIEPKPQPPAPPQSVINTPPPKPIVRTYEDDAAVELKKTNTSLVSVALAERKKRENTAQKNDGVRKERTKYSTLALLSILLVVGGLGAIGYTYIFPRLFPPQPSVITSQPALIYTEHSEEFNITNLTASEIRQELSALNQRPYSGGITAFPVITIKQEEKASVRSYTTSYTFFENFSDRIPRSMLRAFKNTFTLAVASDNVSTSPILVIDIDSFDIAYAGMLRWEKTMVSDLAFLFPVQSTPSTTSTSTLEVDTPEFYDLIVDNKDTRVILDTQGKIRIIYSFPDTKTLVITSDVEILKEVFKRLERRSLTR